MQNMQKNYKGKHLKKNQLKRAQMAGKSLIQNRPIWSFLFIKPTPLKNPLKNHCWFLKGLIYF